MFDLIWKIATAIVFPVLIYVCLLFYRAGKKSDDLLVVFPRVAKKVEGDKESDDDKKHKGLEGQVKDLREEVDELKEAKRHTDKFLKPLMHELGIPIESGEARIQYAIREALGKRRRQAIEDEFDAEATGQNRRALIFDQVQRFSPDPQPPPAYRPPPEHRSQSQIEMPRETPPPPPMTRAKHPTPYASTHRLITGGMRAYPSPRGTEEDPKKKK